MIYLDNAATTQLDPAVKAAMQPYLSLLYGNASMPYQLGVKSKIAIETARKTISTLLQADKGQIFFTSGGTEGNNWAIQGLVHSYHLQHVVTSPMEHMSVLAPIQQLAARHGVQMHSVSITEDGFVDLDDLEKLLQKHPKTLVSLMHGNNETGNLTDIAAVGSICRRYGALFHSDMVQTLGHMPVVLKELPVDVAISSSHKFHGPKGAGLLYLRDGIKLQPLLYGGMQEKGMRAGTESVATIVGMAQALTLAVENQPHHNQHIRGLKKALISGLKKTVPTVIFNGACDQMDKSLPHIVNASLPWPHYKDTLLMVLDSENIYLSAGSACMSGVSTFSHVMKCLRVNATWPVVRFSLSKYNTLEEIILVTKKMATLQSCHLQK